MRYWVATLKRLFFQLLTATLSDSPLKSRTHTEGANFMDVRSDVYMFTSDVQIYSIHRRLCALSKYYARLYVCMLSVLLALSYTQTLPFCSLNCTETDPKYRNNGSKRRVCLFVCVWGGIICVWLLVKPVRIHAYTHRRTAAAYVRASIYATTQTHTRKLDSESCKMYALKCVHICVMQSY